MRSHYVYKITNRTTGEYYYGKRSCNGSWRDDSYMGSGQKLTNKMKAHPDHEWHKEVLMLLDTEEEAYQYEALSIGDRWKTDPLCLNLMGGGLGTTSETASLMWERHRDTILEGQRRVPYEVKQKAGYNCQAKHGERIVNNLNNYARSDRGRARVSEVQTALWADPTYRKAWSAKAKEYKSKPEYKQRRRKPVSLYIGDVLVSVEREDLNGLLATGATFKQKYVHLHNDALGIWTEGVAGWKAAKLLLADKGWAYGKNRSLRKVSITKINLDTAEEQTDA